jgi:predicted Zn-dependent protease
LLHDARNPTAAAEQFEWLRQRWSDDPGALFGLALCRSELGETEQAVELLDTLLRAHPEDCQALTERGKLELQRNHPQEAEEYLQRSLAQGGPEREALFLLKQAQTHQGKREAAQKTQVALEQVETDMKQMEAVLRQVSKAPRDPGPRLELARICLRNGQEQEALRWLLGTLQIAPDHQPTHQALAECYERIGQPEQAALHRRSLGPNSKAETGNERTGPSPKH